MVIKVNGNIRHNGNEYQNGAVIEDISKEQAERLVVLGVASFVTNELKLETDNSNGSGEDDTEFSELLKDFKDEYEYQELKKEASNVGLEFAGNISYENLVKLIVEQGKVDEFFED